MAYGHSDSCNHPGSACNCEKKIHELRENTTIVYNMWMTASGDAKTQPDKMRLFTLSVIERIMSVQAAHDKRRKVSG